MIRKIDELESMGQQERDRDVYESSREQFFEHLRRGAMRHSSLYHYTQWGNFAKMMTPVGDGPCAGKRVMLLSQAASMNDKIEKGWGKEVFFTCFSYSKYEDVAMWMNYGKRSPDAVRVRFDGPSVRDWVDQHRETKDGVYRAISHEDHFEFEKLDPGEIISIEYADVA